uniref:Epithelial sodium channel subunit beta n=1 Tax=Neoceratodus forsteri TaxID=7892 RepID=SCNNB_NEOFS|nr:RecName: Full=Amiloride-sensitive sodium channel subunit beta; AltName: Full=Beta-NaCH; AltName: Full=Epithelial Na(+) channel subunit beta; Short=Beta-ENaC; AltName: Full=Nonvoltage-gated sodium channel 1 subunit beta; AltName: Full=SCNEB [Neoceratodus forsteri]BAL46407.1 epithelial sodium channel subunit beta [Neoceratodus forsteri]
MFLKRWFIRALHRLQKGPGYGYSELFVWYCNNTNTHGPKRLIIEGPKKKTLWSLFTVTFACLVFWQWGLLIQTYLSWGVSVSLSVGFRGMDFPAVTVCNVNPFKYSKVKPLLKELDELVDILLEQFYSYSTNGTLPVVFPDMRSSYLTGDPPPWYQIPLVMIDETDADNPTVTNVLGTDALSPTNNSTTNSSTEARRYKVAFHLCNTNGTDCFYKNFSSSLEAVKEWYTLQYIDIISKLPLSQKVEMGYSGKDFILTCLFGGEACNYDNFTQFYHSSYGNCYVFNWGLDGNVLIVSNPGVGFGLQLALDVNQEEYIPFLTTRAGARFLLHTQNTFPFVETMGTYALVGTVTSVGILVDEVQRMGQPYGTCTTDGLDVPIDNLYSQYNLSYTMQSCLWSCFQIQMVNSCGCAYYLYPLPEGATYCNNQNNSDWAYCYYLLQDSKDHKNECLQTCIQTCNELQFRISTSMADWPSESSEDWIFHVLSYERDDSTNITMKRDGVLKLNLYFKEFNYRVITESVATNVVWLLSNLGGQFGFWMGGSVLCIIEFGEVFIDCIWIAVIRFVKWYKNRKERQVQAQYADPPPTVSELVEGYTNQGFQPDIINSCSPQAQPPDLYLPTTLEIPGTPPPKYDSLRVHPIDTEHHSDSEDL